MDFLEINQDFFKDVYTNYWGGMAFFAVYLLAVIYILKTEQGNKKYILGYMPIVAFLTVFNPLIAGKIVEKLGLASRYYRFYWILPIALTLSIVLIEMICKSKKVTDKLMIAFLAILLINLAGVKFQYEHDDRRDNVYKVSDEVIEVSNIIHDYTDKDQITAYYGLNLMMELRTYDASIVTPVGRFQWDFMDEEYISNTSNEEGYGDLYGNFDVLKVMTYVGAEYSPQIVHDAFEEYNIECFIRDKAMFSNEYIESLGFIKIGETESYEVYWCVDAEGKILSLSPMTIDELKNVICDGEYVTRVKEETIIVPGLEETYRFLYLADLHIIVPDEHVVEEDMETVEARYCNFAVNPNGEKSKDIYSTLINNINQTDLDAVLMGGDMMDYLSEANWIHMKNGLDELKMPYLFSTADHDSQTYYTSYEGDEKISLQNDMSQGLIDTIEEDSFIILSINESTGNLCEEAVEEIKAVFEKGKPIILMIHVPLDSSIDSGLGEKSKEVWGDRKLLWGTDCTYVPNEVTQEFIDMVVAEDSPVVAVLSGHLHFEYECMLNETVKQYVYNPAYSGEVVLFTVKGETVH